MLSFLRYSTFETLLIVFVLLLFVLLPFVIIGIIFFVLRRNNKNRALWGKIAKNLIFTMPNPKKLEMFGKYKNCDVRISIGARRAGGGEYSRTEFYTYCTSEFPHSLRFLLNISSPKGLLSGVLNSNKIKLGQTNFDQVYDVKCYDADVLRRLLLADFPSDKTQNIMGDLMWANQTAGIVKISDKRVYIEKSGQIGDENVLRQMIEITAHLANRFKTARENFPLAVWEKQLLQNWQQMANKNDFTFDSKHMLMQGVYKNFPVFIALETEKEIWQTRIKLKFPHSLMIGLKILPENSIHKAFTWLGVQDIKIGIKEFDDAFIVKGKNVQMAKHKLQPDLCRQLTGLNRQASAISVNDDEISIAFDKVLGDERELKSYLEAVVSTARMFGR